MASSAKHAPTLHVGTEAPYTPVLRLSTVADPNAFRMQPAAQPPTPYLAHTGSIPPLLVQTKT